MTSAIPEGSIELIIGNMCSSKSSLLLARIRRYRVAKLRCVILRYSKDNRYHESKFSTHDQVMADAVSISSLNDLPDSYFDDFDVIAIDEGQFMHPLVDFCDKHANAGRIVIVAALDGDFNRKPFGEVCDLVPLCETVTKLSAVCMVYFKSGAPFTKRLVQSDAIELIGGLNEYEARCRKCLNAPIPNRDNKSNHPTILSSTVQEAITSKESAFITPTKSSSSRQSSPMSTGGSSVGSSDNDHDHDNYNSDVALSPF